MNLRRHIYEFIVDQQTRWHFHPTREVIRQVFQNRSGDVDLHLEELAREGLLGLPADHREPIAMMPTFDRAQLLELRYGRPPHSNQTANEVRKAEILLNLKGLGIEMEEDMYVMHVADDSMIDGDLYQGDIALMKLADPKRGDIVAVDVNGETLLRRYIEFRSIPHILAENPIRPDLQLALELPFHGVLWGLLRVNPRRGLLSTFPKRNFKYPTQNLSLDETAEGSRFSTPNPSVQPLPKRDSSAAQKLRGKRHPKVSGPKSTLLRYDAPQEWAKPPSGIELNDAIGSEYRDSVKLLDEDEKKYGWALDEALKKYERKRRES